MVRMENSDRSMKMRISRTGEKRVVMGGRRGKERRELGMNGGDGGVEMEGRDIYYGLLRRKSQTNKKKKRSRGVF